MRRFVRALVTSALIAGLIAGTAASAPARVAEKSAKKFCERLLAISSTVPDVSGESGFADASAAFVKQYKKLAKAAPTGELRKAAKTIAKYYGRIADGVDPNSAAASYNDNEIEAIATITEYSLANCPAAGVGPDASQP
ncbi:MAG: hypothetical protein WD598_01350 [Acidimicrobiia bacterium]